MGGTIFSWWFLRRLSVLALGTVLFTCLLGAVMTHAEGDRAGSSGPAWATPGPRAMRKVGGLGAAGSAPVLFSNLDCTPTSYRTPGVSSMLEGCFTQTAFGLFDSDHYKVIFNGTDEGLPLVPYTPHQLLAPWPKSMDLISMEPLGTGGAVLSLYRNPLGVMKDQRDLLGRLTAKELTAAPDMVLDDPSGKPLVVNPQTLAFSDGGSWLVAETLNGAFVRVNLATLSVTAFATAYGCPGCSGLWQSRVAVTEDGRFIAIANDMAGEFKVYDLNTCDGRVDGLHVQDCGSYDYHSFVTGKVSDLLSVRRVWFVNDGVLVFSAVSTDHVSDGTYELAPASSIASLTDYIGLGDSYTSGEGAFDYMQGTDGPDNLCHLSARSYPLLLSHDLFGRGGHSVACSGAVIDDISSTGEDYRGQARGGASWQELQRSKPDFLETVESGFMPGWISQHRFVRRWQAAVVTVSIGGNDIGFGDLLKDCVEPHISRHMSDNTCYDTYEKRLGLASLIDRTVPRWTALYEQLERESPGTRFYAIGYPSIAYAGGDCADNVQLNRSELEFADETIGYLNRAIMKAAATAGVTYVDISQALKGHRLCEARGYDVAVNGLTAGDDVGLMGVGVLGHESYHPNALGHELIEQSILRQTHDLKAPEPHQTAQEQIDSVNDDDSAAGSLKAKMLLGAPVTGQTVYALVPDDGLAPAAGRRGSDLPLSADGTKDGLRPGAVYTVRLDGPSGPALGTVGTDASDIISGKVMVPSDTAPGGHTLEVIGPGQSGEPVDISQPVYIQADDHDADGDGIDDVMDTCPGALDSGRDADRDGIDDICDGLIASNGAGPAATGSQTKAGVNRGDQGTGSMSQAQLSGTSPGIPSGNGSGHAVLGASTDSPGPDTANGSIRLEEQEGSPAPNKTYGDRPYRLIVGAILFLVLILVGKINKRLRFWVQ